MMLGRFSVSGPEASFTARSAETRPPASAAAATTAPSASPRRPRRCRSQLAILYPNSTVAMGVVVAMIVTVVAHFDRHRKTPRQSSQAGAVRGHRFGMSCGDDRDHG